MEFLFCRVNSSYCDFLRDKDRRVPQTMDEKRTRPFLGIVFSVNGKNYYVPLTSPKKKHLRMSNSSDFLKIEDGKYGAMNFNNMIPVPTECLEEADILIHKGDSPEKIKYKTLCQRQYEWCKANRVQIVRRAVRLYDIVTTKKPIPHFCNAAATSGSANAVWKNTVGCTAWHSRNRKHEMTANDNE